MAAALAGLAGCRGRGTDDAPQGSDPAVNGAALAGAEALPPGAVGASVDTVVTALRPSPVARADRQRADADAGALPVLRVSELAPAAPEACPRVMTFVPGGEFWMGSARSRGSRSERPRFLTRVADYCIDTYEVTSASYAQCVQRGACSAPRGSQNRCNYGRREDHPVNCVDWAQADAYCKAQGARLPTELEWEYAARGGARYLPYSWGVDAPGEHTCWNRNASCPVGSFGAGAFGLHDMSGNVWEWTQDWFGEYPWPELSGSNKIFRGGSWSGNVERWLGTTLRNRAAPERWGSYLGFRCAQLAKDAVCPFGPGDEPGLCRHGVLDVECSQPGERFNGQRCAVAGAPACGRASKPVAGHGCVRR